MTAWGSSKRGSRGAASLPAHLSGHAPRLLQLRHNGRGLVDQLLVLLPGRPLHRLNLCLQLRCALLPLQQVAGQGPT